MVADIPKDLQASQNIKFIDEFKDFSPINFDFLVSKPYMKKLADQTQIHTDSHSAYNWMASLLDIGDFYAAYEIGSKFKSRESIYKELGLDFTGKKECTCKEINEKAL